MDCVIADLYVIIYQPIYSIYYITYITYINLYVIEPRYSRHIASCVFLLKTDVLTLVRTASFSVCHISPLMHTLFATFLPLSSSGNGRLSWIAA